VLLGCGHMPLCMQVTVDDYMHKEMDMRRTLPSDM